MPGSLVIAYLNCSASSLQARPASTQSFPPVCREKTAAAMIRTIVQVVAHCHSLGVMHR